MVLHGQHRPRGVREPVHGAAVPRRGRAGGGARAEARAVPGAQRVRHGAGRQAAGTTVAADLEDSGLRGCSHHWSVRLRVTLLLAAIVYNQHTQELKMNAI